MNRKDNYIKIAQTKGAITIDNNPKIHIQLRKNIEKPNRLTY